MGWQLVNVETEEENVAIKEHLFQNAGNFTCAYGK